MIKDIFNKRKPVIGMVHVKPLPGTGKYAKSQYQSVAEILESALKDAKALKEGGIHGLIIENAGSGPYQIGEHIDPIETAMLSVIAARIWRETKLPFGISMSVNGVKQAVAVAKASNGSFVRATGWVNGYYSSAGFVSPCAAACVRYRKLVNGENIRVFADIQVKNGSHIFIQDKTLEEQALDARAACADAVILTGNKTGLRPDMAQLERLKKTVRLPLVVGSGVTADNLNELYPYAEAFIVGTGFKEHKRIEEQILVERVREFMDEYEKLGGSAV